MSLLTINHSRSFLNAYIAHQILIDGHSVGIMKGEKVSFQIPSGQYDITIQSMIPFFSATQTVQIPLRGETILTFSEPDKWMDSILAIDILFFVLTFFITIPSPWYGAYKVISDGFFVLWIVWMWCIRKKYFRIRISHKSQSSIAEL